MKVGFAGDWHGSIRAATHALTNLANRGVIDVIQVGDFGFHSNKVGTAFLDNVNREAGRLGVTVYVVPGNHEDYDFLAKVLEHPDGWSVVRPHILVAPRGLRDSFDNRSFVFLGGAASVDRMWRQSLGRRAGKKLWWAEEVITEADVAKVVAAGHADVMVGHDAPFYPAVDRVIAPNPHGFPQLDLDYAAESRRLMHEAAYAVMPKLFVHGHYHFATDQVRSWSSIEGGPGEAVSDDIRGITRIVGLNMETQPRSLAILETETMEMEVLP